MAGYLQATDAINEYLIAQDGAFAAIIKSYEPVKIELADDCFASLAEAIIGQQLSGKVADVIIRRVYNLCGQAINPRVILEIPAESLREAGMSYSKINYVKYLASAVEEKTVSFENITSLSNGEITAMLTAVKGIGQWTVEMVLMFTLGREDVFALDDLGIQQAICKLYKIDATDKKAMKEKMLTISKKWSPYRTYACRYLWGWKDNTPSAP